MSTESARECELIRQLAGTPELIEEVSASTGPELNAQVRLRERFPADLVRDAFTLVELRRRAAEKFSRAERMWFDRVGLEQATSEAVARHKAARFRGVAPPVFDLCCGIGGDSIALAGEVGGVVSVDSSAAACLRTELNSRVYGVESKIETRIADAEQVETAGAWVHVDPDRRASRRRAVRLEEYRPSLEFLHRLMETAPGGAVKLSPASNFGGKFPGCEVELVSLRGECKEATVWFGDRVSGWPARATILPEGWTLAADPWQFRSRVTELSTYLFDPDAAIVRAGLVDALAEKLNLSRLDDAEEYLTGEQFVASPAAAAFEVLAELPNQPKEIRGYFRSTDFGEVEIKCRHVPVDVEKLRRRLPLQGREKGVLIIARLQGKTKALVCRRMQG